LLLTSFARGGLGGFASRGSQEAAWGRCECTRYARVLRCHKEAAQIAGTRMAPVNRRLPSNLGYPLVIFFGVVFMNFSVSLTQSRIVGRPY